jgi:glycerophosphoryl diester phosphodiesterase
MDRFYPYTQIRVLTGFFGHGRPLVFAHRGGAALAPENTLAAFDHGVSLGADGIELDVRLSRDGIPVVHHDPTVERTTGTPGAVSGMTADELARLDAGFGFQGPAGRAYQGQSLGIPTLAAVLRRYPGHRVIIELKANEAELAAAVIAVVRSCDAVDRVCLGAFGLRVLRAARRLAPDMATSASHEEVRWALYRSWVGWPVTRPPYAGFQVPERSGLTRVVSARFVEIAHRARLGVQVWTVNTQSDARRLLGWGADALITDRPDLIVPLVRGAGIPGCGT